MQQQKRPLGLIKKLSEIMGKVSYVEKKGYNEFHKYEYAQEADFLAAVRSHLSEAGIFIFTSFSKVLSEEWIPTAKGQTKLIIVRYTHEICDSSTGESVKVRSIGSGVDSQDKAVYKAITGAMKYFISKNFLIPTGDDPEADHADQGSAQKPASSEVGGTSGVRKAGQASKQIEKLKPEKKEEVKKKEPVKPHSETYGKFLDQMRTEKERFIKVKGEKEGPELYYQVLAEFNVQHSNEVPSEDILTQYAIFYQMKALVEDLPAYKKEDAAAKVEEYIQKIIARDRELEAKEK